VLFCIRQINLLFWHSFGAKTHCSITLSSNILAKMKEQSSSDEEGENWKQKQEALEQKVWVGIGVGQNIHLLTLQQQLGK
jgi:hypothetical protein